MAVLEEAPRGRPRGEGVGLQRPTRGSRSHVPEEARSLVRPVHVLRVPRADCREVLGGELLDGVLRGRGVAIRLRFTLYLPRE